MGTTITTIKSKLVDLLKLVKTPTYQTNLPNTNIYGSFSKNILRKTQDVDYPKCSVVFDEKTNVQNPGMRSFQTFSFMLIFVHKQKKPGVGDDANVLAEKFIEDIERLVALNHDLFGTVHNITMRDATTDSGYAEPEGVAVIALQIEVYRND
jgi:hypothetical protein